METEIRQPEQPETTPEPKRKRSRFSRRNMLIIMFIIVVLAIIVVTALSSFGIIPTQIANTLSVSFAALAVILPLLNSIFQSPRPDSPAQPTPVSGEKTGEDRPTPVSGEKTGEDRQTQPLDPLSASPTILVQPPIVPGVVFPFITKLTDPSLFFGRDLERAILINRTRLGASTSIISPNKMGATWLIDYLQLVKDRELGANFRIACINSMSPRCATINDFIFEVLKELGRTPTPRRRLKGLLLFEEVVEDLKSQNIIPVLCIDNFENLSKRPWFREDFLSGLRALTEYMVLIIASKHSLLDILGNYTYETSALHNIFETLVLHSFSEAEANNFVRVKRNEVHFTDKEQAAILRYARDEELLWPPLRLQLVAKTLLEDQCYTPESYRPDQDGYWESFRMRIEEKYRAVVGAAIIHNTPQGG